MVFIIGAVFFSYALGLHQRSVACNVMYQDSLDTIATQSQTVLSDMNSACTRSYGVLTDWDMCLIQAEKKSPPEMLTYIKPAVTTFMLFLREKKKDMAILKLDHDERCKDYTDLMFYPPETE